jgi:hypothetical protein
MKICVLSTHRAPCFHLPPQLALATRLLRIRADPRIDTVHKQLYFGRVVRRCGLIVCLNLFVCQAAQCLLMPRVARAVHPPVVQPRLAAQARCAPVAHGRSGHGAAVAAVPASARAARCLNHPLRSVFCPGCALPSPSRGSLARGLARDRGKHHVVAPYSQQGQLYYESCLPLSLAKPRASLPVQEDGSPRYRPRNFFSKFERGVQRRQGPSTAQRTTTTCSQR